MTSLERTWHAVPATVPRARHAVLAHLVAAETSDPPLNDIALAVSEAVSNVVVHAYRDREPGVVQVRVESRPGQVELTVDDHGSGMAPRPDSPGLGLGLSLMARMSRRFEVSALKDGGTRLCMSFDAEPPNTARSP